MSGESQAWSTLRSHLKSYPHLFAQNIERIENAVAAGTPDTFFSFRALIPDEKRVVTSSIWLEGKHVPNWPFKETSKAPIGVTVEQANTLQRIAVTGHPAGVWVRVSQSTTGPFWLWLAAVAFDPLLSRLASKEATVQEVMLKAKFAKSAKDLVVEIVRTATEGK